MWLSTLLQRFGIILEKIRDRNERSGIAVKWRSSAAFHLGLHCLPRHSFTVYHKLKYFLDTYVLGNKLPTMSVYLLEAIEAVVNRIIVSAVSWYYLTFRLL